MDGRLGPSTLQETQCATELNLEAKLEALEQRLKAVPGKLPVAKTWHPETVVYQSEFVSHEGATWQATKDTARCPGGSDDWILIARAGRDAVTPNIRGTFDVREKYQQLDIVALDGGSFIAKRDNPGVCPGDGWQLLCKQGKAGRPGTPGERGLRGEEGEKGEPGISTVSWQVDRAQYRVSPLMSNGTVGPMLDLHALAQQIIDEVGRMYSWDRE